MTFSESNIKDEERGLRSTLSKPIASALPLTRPCDLEQPDRVVSQVPNTDHETASTLTLQE